MNSDKTALSRRNFLGLTAGIGGALALGLGEGTPAQAQTPTVSDAGLEAHYTFDNTLDSRVASAFFNRKIAGTFGSNSPEVTAPVYVPGKVGQALKFDGNWHVSLGEWDKLTAQKTFSVSLWIRYQGAADTAIIGNKDWSKGTNYGWALTTLSYKEINWAMPHSGRFDVSLHNGNDAWHFLTVVFDREAEKMSVFLDGNHITSEVLGAHSLESGFPLLVGSSGNDGWQKRFVGYVDDLKIWSRALTLTDHMAQWDAANGVAAPPPFQIGPVPVAPAKLPEKFLPIGETNPQILRRFSMIACVKTLTELPSFDNIAALRPDLALWMGDNVYADARDEATLRAKYKVLQDNPRFWRLKEHIPMMGTWDNHDFGTRYGGKHFSFREKSKQVFCDFWDEAPYSPRRKQEGVYKSALFGTGDKTAQIILLDTRYNRLSEANPDDDVLGPEQWDWFAAQLEKPARLRFIVSSQQVLIPINQPLESWAKNPHAQSRLFTHIVDKKVGGVIFLTGDQHYAEVLRQPGVLGYNATEWMFAGVDQDETHFPNVYRVGKAAHAPHKYSHVDINWETPDPQISYQVRNLNNDLMLEDRLRLSQLTFGAPPILA